MAEKKYRAFYSGEILPGRDPETVLKDLARVLTLGPDEAERLFSGGRVLLSDNMSKDQALEQKTAFARVGAFLVIESYEVEQAPETLPEGFLEDAIDLSRPMDFVPEEEVVPEPAEPATPPSQDPVGPAAGANPLSAVQDALSGPASFAAPDIPLELLQNALLAYASEAIEEETFFLADLSHAGNAKTGLLVSGSHLYVKDIYGPVLRIPLNEILNARLVPGRNVRMAVNGAIVLHSVPDTQKGPLTALAFALSQKPDTEAESLSDEIPGSWIAIREKVRRTPGSGIFANASVFREFLRNRVFLGRLADTEDNRMLKAMATGAAIVAFAFAVMAAFALVKNAGIIWGLSPVRMAAAYMLFLAVIAASFRYGIAGFIISAVFCAFVLLLLSKGGLTFTAMTVLMAVSPLVMGLAAVLGAILGASLGYIAWEFFHGRKD